MLKSMNSIKLKYEKNHSLVWSIFKSMNLIKLKYESHLKVWFDRYFIKSYV